MSVIECLQVFQHVDIPRYLEVLQNEFGARPNPQQADTYLIDDPALPFYQPRQYEKHMSVMSFNYAPLSSLLIVALIDHPELVAPETMVVWSAEQELVAAGTLAEMAQLFDQRFSDQR
jgi:hypothetical protein